jgi:hypothetical protein
MKRKYKTRGQRSKSVRARIRLLRFDRKMEQLGKANRLIFDAEKKRAKLLRELRSRERQGKK